MDARSDPTYLKLYQDYARAIQAFENATKNRRRVRNQLAVKRSPVLKALSEWSRRPVGAPVGYRIPQAQVPRPTPASTPRTRQIYLGKILGWAKIVYTNPVTPQMDPGANLEVDNLYDNTSLSLYWNAKHHYEECKRTFFDYLRRQNIDLHTDQAKQALNHGVNLQHLGVEHDEGPAFMAEARREVEAACRNIWGLYQSSPSPKSTEMIVLLLEGIADSQYVGLESPTIQAMTGELARLRNSGALR